MYRSTFPRDVFAEMDRLQREMQQAFDLSPTIRGHSLGGFPALNVGGTPEAVEVYAFVPGLDPDAIEVTLERGQMTIAGERKSPVRQAGGDKAMTHIAERFEGAFRRVISLPEDANPDAVQAVCSDGVLHITVRRHASAQPRRIAIQ